MLNAAKTQLLLFEPQQCTDAADDFLRNVRQVLLESHQKKDSYDKTYLNAVMSWVDAIDNLVPLVRSGPGHCPKTPLQIIAEVCKFGKLAIVHINWAELASGHTKAFNALFLCDMLFSTVKHGMFPWW